MASWLRCGEAMMRRLLLIEAAAFAKPSTRPLLRTSRQRARNLMSSMPEEESKKWRVSFRCFSSPACGGRVSARSAPSVVNGDGKRVRRSREERWSSEYWPKPKFRAALPLARRYEALLRAFNDPLAYAQRLSRRLHATPHRLREVLRAPPDAAHRIDRYAELSTTAETKAAVFNTS